MVLHTESSRIRKELLSVFSRGLVESEPLLHAVIAQDQQKIEEALSQLIMDYIDTAVAL